MASVENVAVQVQGNAAVDADKPVDINLIAKWISNRYAEYAATARLRARKEIGSVIVPGAVNTGTATATFGSPTVTLAGIVPDAAWVSRHIRLRTNWYRITAVVGQDLTLDTNFVENTVSAAGYVIVPRIVTLPAGTRWLGRMVNMERRHEVRVSSASALNLGEPERTLVNSDGPWVFALLGRTAEDEIEIEFYPYPTKDTRIDYVYWSQPPVLALNDMVEGVDDYILVEGALIDLYRYRAAQEANAGRTEVAAYWRNEYRAQETLWRRKLEEAKRGDRPVDDITFIYHRHGLPGATSRRDITTAEDEIAARGNRP